jgi:hypothetical protein
MAFQPVRRDAKWTYLVMPKSAGLMISYVDGLLRIVFAVPRKPLMGQRSSLLMV